MSHTRRIRRQYDNRRGMFQEKLYHDWTSHGTDDYRYGAVVEDQMTNSPPRPMQATTGLVPPYYPGLGL